MLDPILLELSLLFGLCVAVALVVHRFRMPPIVGFLLVGIVAGPGGVGLVRHHELVEQLAEIGVVVLLFTVGMELAVGRIGAMRRAIFVGGGIQVAGTVAVGAAVAACAGLSFGPALFVGFLVCLSSTAAITKILSDRGRIGTPVGKHAIGVCVAQDLAVVPMLLLIPALSGAEGGFGDALLGVFRATGWLAVTAVLAWLLVPRILAVVARTRSRELFVLSVITICLSLSVVTAHLGLSLALGAFLAGVVIGSSEFHHQAVSEIEPFRDTLASLFFLSIGMLFDADVLLQEPWLVGGCLLAVIGGKALLSALAMAAVGLPWNVGWRTALTLAQIGEFGFVLVQVAHGRGLFDPRFEQVFFVVAVLSIALTPLWFALGDLLARRRGIARRDLGSGEGASSGALRDHVILVGFGPVGRMLAESLDASEIDYHAVEMNAATVRAERQNGRRIILGDATRPMVMRALGVDRARLLVIAVNDPEGTRRVAELARRMSPHLHIIARASYLGEVIPLHRLEVDEVVPQELETSVEIVTRALRHFLVAEDDVADRVARIRGAVETDLQATILPDGGGLQRGAEESGDTQESDAAETDVHQNPR